MRRNWPFGGALLLFALVCLYPLLILFWNTLFTPEGFTLSRYQGLLLLTPRQWALLGRSIAFAVGSSLVSFLVAFPLAVLLGRSNCPYRKLFSWLFLIPLLIPPHASAIAWLSLLGKDSILRDLVPVLDGVSPYNLLGAVIIFGVSLFPLVLIILLSGLQQIDPSLEEAGLLNFPAFRTFRLVDLPLLKEHVLVGLLLAFLLGLTQYGVPSLLQVNTYPVEVFIQFGAHFDHASGAVLAVPLIVCSLVAVGFLSRLLVSRGTVVSLSFRHSRLFEMTPVQRAVGSAVLCIVFLLLVGTPVLQLAKMTGSLESVWAALKTSWEPILFSCQIALFSCILTPMLALCVLIAEDRVSARTRNILRFLWVLPLGVPPVLYGLGFIAGWNRPGLQWLYQGSGVVVLAMVAMFFPISEEILRAAKSQVSKRYSEAADTSALSPWLKLRKIWLPLLRPGLAAAAAITFLFGFRELGASLLILPPGKETVSLKIYSLVHYGAHQLVSALCLILIAVTALVVGLMSWWGDKEYA